MQFSIPQLNDYDPLVWNTSYVSGIEGIPWAGRIALNANGFSIQRGIDESGRLSIVWPNREFGASVLSTGSLRCQDQPYLLPVELARGTLHRVRQRAFDWQRLGLKVPESYGQNIETALGHFIEAVLLRDKSPTDSAKQAQLSIDAALAASRPLCRAFIHQVMQFRTQQERQLGTLLGVRLGHGKAWSEEAASVRPMMNAVCIQPAWHLIEADTDRVSYDVFDKQLTWANEEKLRVVCGPLISLQQHAIQQWMFLLDSFEAFYQGAVKYVQQTVERFRGRVQIWNVAAGLNCPSELNLNEEQVMRLAIGLIQAVRRADPKTPVTITVDMPWAEYLGQKDNAISPIHFADTLVRADLGLSGIALEMNFHCWPGGCLPRDLVDISDLIDQWSILGVPLIGIVSAPAHVRADPQAWAKYGSVGDWRLPRSADSDGDGSAYALEIIQMMLAKQIVHGIFWNQHSDRDKHPYPHAGLLDRNGRPRPLLDGLTQLRNRFVQ
jgi:hypothetical protein